MKRYDAVYLLKIQSATKAQCQLAAARAQLHLSEWMRDALRYKLKLESRRNGKRRTA